MIYNAELIYLFIPVRRKHLYISILIDIVKRGIKMKKKLVVFLICMMLVVTMFSMFGTAEYEKNKLYNITTKKSYEVETIDCRGADEILDQNQTYLYGFMVPVIPDLWGAQSFKPTVMTLTRVELYITKHLYPSNETVLTVSIRDSLNGSDLTSKEIVAGDYYPKWVEFDFQDIEVVPEQTYYIVTKGDKGNETGAFGMMAVANNPYGRGDAWVWDYDYWEKIDYEEYPECDMTFKTYGLNEAPDTPTIDGPTEGKVGIEYTYNLTTTDMEGYNVWYYINWGGGSIDEWIGPYASGENVTVSHTWKIKNTYEIRVKAKDIHGFESDWATLEISIPKNQINNLWMRWLERFPILQRLLNLLENI